MLGGQAGREQDAIDDRAHLGQGGAGPGRDHQVHVQGRDDGRQQVQVRVGADFPALLRASDQGGQGIGFGRMNRSLTAAVRSASRCMAGIRAAMTSAS